VRGRLVALGALVIGGGAGLLGFELVRARPAAPDPTPKLTAALDDAVTQLDREIATARTRVQGQARLIAGQQIVRGIIVTDPFSAADALGEIGIELTRPGEILQIGQRAGSTLTQLYLEPKTAAGGIPSPRDGKRASREDLVSDQLWVSELAEVLPRKMRDANDGAETDYMKNGHPVIGYVMVSRAVELRPVLKRLETAQHTGHLELAGERRTFGALPAGARTLTRPLLAMPGAWLAIGVPPTPPAEGYSFGLLVAGGITAVLGIGAVLLGLVLGRRPPKKHRFLEPPRRPTPLPPPRSLLKSLLDSSPSLDSEFDHTTIDPGPPSMEDSIVPRPAGTPFQTTQPPFGSAIHPPQVRPGTVIGRWEILRQLGGGGMAEVFLAQARGEGGFEKQVAIKVMHPHLSRDERTIAHFLDEARLAAGITHQNVVAIHDLGRIGDDYFIVMEYIDGLDLERLLVSTRAAARPVPIHIGLGILRRICDGLTAAHQATSPDGVRLDIIHRDVKSANVLVSRQGAVKVVDFGIAKATAQLHNSLVGETKGTPAMMAPEQRVGAVVDVRADVYSVGALAYELLTGQPVNVDFVALAHLGIENWPHLPLPSVARPGLPAALDSITFGAMAFDREHRPADCAELELQLEGVMQAQQLVASDKDIARWLLDELRLLAPSSPGPTPIGTPSRI
jgi:tRNA A-37 threonylcarbamoyl transferase component Bud32